jgi:hypothetical protein
MARRLGAGQRNAPRPGRPPRFKLVAPEPAEVDIQAACAKALNALLLPPAFWWAMPVGHLVLSGAQMARLARIGTKAGLPDIFLLHGRRLFGIEVKTKSGRLSKTRLAKNRHGALREVTGQEEMFPRLLEAGAADIAVVTSLDEMLAALRRWGIPLRSR